MVAMYVLILMMMNQWNVLTLGMLHRTTLQTKVMIIGRVFNRIPFLTAETNTTGEDSINAPIEGSGCIFLSLTSSVILITHRWFG